MFMSDGHLKRIYGILFLAQFLSTSCYSYIHKADNIPKTVKADKAISDMLSGIKLSLKHNIDDLEKKSKRNGCNTQPKTLFRLMVTNTREVYLKSKTGYYLQMDANGFINGRKSWNETVVFIMESMASSIIRLRSKSSGKYICISESQKILVKKIPGSECLLRQYMEENKYVLFWSCHSDKLDGENGWFLAIRHNGKLKSPARTKIGDRATMFHVHHV